MRVERPDDVVPAILRGLDATRNGQPVVLEMITKEDPVYPVASQVIPEVASQQLAAV